MASAPITAEAAGPAAEAKPAAKKASPIAFIAAMLVLTGIGVGFGGLLGLHLLGMMEKAKPGEQKAQAGQDAGAGSPQAAKSRYPGGANVRTLPPIVTNLASPERTWIRLEALLVSDAEQAADANALEAQIAEDIVAFLRTLALAQIQGPSGFQHLREDLNDRVRVRSGGKVRDLVVQALIIE
jgi:flagellar protein FliL